ncbi:hypothetical protein SCLARK_001460 [Spiroplasma clarkii]|uniref:DUF3196 domain-containing protein n=1 Tax=Spiroplasma clarkii TaxID=2139 RepID=A0A1Y0L1X6_9MOLU|nr:DUF3196 family protein [Spiroplasma clarkii]ARU91977.1 hypothetical protein SCLARK_001460 [Spiroplasma clarkii]ATX71317.1 hypothetical protein SCLAR_v1c10150 [Spiroplasma clarkii]
MADNYYETLLKDIQIFIDNQEYNNAAKLITNELAAPYIPGDIEVKLYEYNQIINQHLVNDLDDSMLTWNVDKVAQIMQQSLNQEMHLLAFEALRGLNARQIIPLIKTYLQDKAIKNEYKTFLMMILIEQKVDEDFLVYKNDNKIEIIFNPATFDVSESQKFLADLEMQLELLVNSKNPSLYTVCKNYASAYFYNVFPIFRLDQFELNDVLAFIIMHSKKALGLEWEKPLTNLLTYNHDKALMLLEKYQASF